MRHLRKMKSLALSAMMLIVSASLVPVFNQPAFAQATTGSISGTVSDESGAVVPNATVVVKNQATGVESPSFRSTGEGIYNIPNLLPGVYTITVESANFKRAVYTDVTVRLGENTVIDVILQAGGVSETVTIVAGSETVIQRDSSQVSSSFTSRQVQDLPSNVAGGGIDTLALLVPGVTPGFAGAANSNGTALSVNGNRTRSNNFSIDGQDNNDLSIGGPSFFVTNQDAVQDFQIITNNFSAEYGRNQGAVVNIVTRAGTNDFHGTGFWFHRDRKLFETLTNLERASGLEEAPPLLYNVFGGTLGGPIVRDRAFFFGSYQGTRTRESAIVRSGQLAILAEELPRLRADFPDNPLIAMIADFSPFALSDFGSLRPRTDLADPFDTITIGGNTYLAAFPEREFQTSINSPYKQEEITGRFDLRINDRNSLWSRYLFQDGTFLNAIANVQANGFTGDVPYRSQNIGGAWTYQVSSNSLNEFRTSYQRLFVNFGGGCEGLRGCIPDPANVGTAISQITFASIRGNNTGGTLATIGGGAGFPQGRTVQVYQFVDNFSLTRGRHQMIMGADIRRLINSSTFLPNFNGTFAVSTEARLVANAPFQTSLVVGEPTIDYNETDQFYFIQDNWKVRDNLTLNLGLRYEYTGQPINTLHELTTERESDPATALWRQNLPLEARTVPNISGDKNNFAPRVGFAYTPRFGEGSFFRRLFGEQDTTVIRGGYSIAYDATFHNILTNVAGSSPVVFSNVVQNSATAPAFPAPQGLLNGENVRAFANSNGQIARNIFDPRFQNWTTVAQDFHTPYAQQWSFGIQRQVNQNNIFEVRYLGTHGVDLFQNVNGNPRIDRLLNGFTTTSADGEQTFTFPGFPNLVPAGLTPLTCTDNPATPDNESVCNGRLLPRRLITERQNSGQSLYHSMQTRYNGRMFNQLNVGASYTWSKALDNISEVFFFQENSISQYPFNITDADRSYSGFDRRHALSLSGIWDVPFLKEQRGVIGHVLGGWQVNGTYVLSSGLRYTPVQNLNHLITSYQDPFVVDTMRPFWGNPDADRRLVGITDVDAQLLGFVPGGTFSPTGFFLLNDINASGALTPVTTGDVRYVYNGPGAAARFGSPYGNIPRNAEIGPKINQVNMGFFKNTRITEGVRLQFRTEIFNLLNHPNAGYGLAAAVGGPGGIGPIPDNNLENAGVPGTAFGEFRDIDFGRRIIQFGLKIIF